MRLDGIIYKRLWKEDGINFNIHSEPFIKRSEKFYDLDHWLIDPRVAYIPEDDMYYIIRPINSSWGCSSLLLRTKDFKSVEEMGIVALPHNRVPSLFQGKVNGRYARLYLFWSLLRISNSPQSWEIESKIIWMKQPKAALALDFSYFQHASKLVIHDRKSWFLAKSGLFPHFFLQ